MLSTNSHSRFQIFIALILIFSNLAFALKYEEGTITVTVEKIKKPSISPIQQDTRSSIYPLKEKGKPVIFPIVEKKKILNPPLEEKN